MSKAKLERVEQITVLTVYDKKESKSYLIEIGKSMATKPLLSNTLNMTLHQLSK